MRKIFTTILMISAPLALAACNKPAAEPEETVVTEETVPVEPATDGMAPDGAEDAAMPATDDPATPAVDESGDPTEGGTTEK